MPETRTKKSGTSDWIDWIYLLHFLKILVESGSIWLTYFKGRLLFSYVNLSQLVWYFTGTIEFSDFKTRASKNGFTGST